MGVNTNKVIKGNRVAITIFSLSLVGAIGLGIIVLQGILQEGWYIDLAICALGATAFTSLFEVLGGEG